MAAKTCKGGKEGNNKQRFQLFIGIFTYWQQTVKTEASYKQDEQITLYSRSVDTLTKKLIFTS